MTQYVAVMRQSTIVRTSNGVRLSQKLSRVPSSGRLSQKLSGVPSFGRLSQKLSRVPSSGRKSQNKEGNDNMAEERLDDCNKEKSIEDLR